jgi:very-short-patch-repair endonuclease
MVEPQLRIRDVTIGMRDKARELRHSQTPAEVLLWSHLRNRKLDGLKFRRQCALGDYVVDFLCAEHRIAVEIDGKYHDFADQQEYDDLRSRNLHESGYRVLRFRNDEVFDNISTVLDSIRRATQNPGGRSLHDVESLSLRGGGTTKWWVRP